MLPPKQILQRLPIALAQVKADKDIFLVSRKKSY